MNIKTVALEIIHHYFSFSAARVRKIIRHPRQASWIISSVQGNNEVSVWDMETTNQHLSLWASNTPPLSKANVSTIRLWKLLFYSIVIWVSLISTSLGRPTQRLCNVHLLWRTFEYAVMWWNGPTNSSVVSETLCWRVPSYHTIGQWFFNKNIVLVRVSDKIIIRLWKGK